jgi:hypothetical protein
MLPAGLRADDHHIPKLRFRLVRCMFGDATACYLLAMQIEGAANMTGPRDSQSLTTDRGICTALLFALVAERLALFYEHDKWMTAAQGATLAADWLARSKRRLPNDRRKHLSVLSDDLARQIVDAVSREAGLHITHEMMESLDPNYPSDIAQSLTLECARLLEDSSLASGMD